MGLFAVLGTSELANAQGKYKNDKDQKRQEKIDREQAKLDQQRQAEWARRNGQFRTSRQTGTGYYSIDPNSNVTAGRYRVNRNGTWYNTDNRGADLLRQAVNEGYRQGFAAGRSDRNGRRRTSWTNSNVYQTGTYGYQSGVNQGQYQYYFRQGFQRGYQDGTNSQYQDGYNGNYQYGTNNGGTLNILGTILNQVLNLQSY
jgi:hypothetical protein